MGVQQFRSHASSVYCIAVSPDARLCASGDGADMALIWDAATGALLHTLRGHGDTVIAIGFNFNGSLVATGSLDTTVRVWDVVDGSCIATCEGMGGDVEWMQWHPKGDVILAGSTDCTAWMWHIKKGKEPQCMAVFAGHVEAVTAGCFTGNGKSIVTGSADGSIRVWNPNTSSCTTTMAGHGFHDDAIHSIACSADVCTNQPQSSHIPQHLLAAGVNNCFNIYVNMCRNPSCSVAARTAPPALLTSVPGR
jgi:WD40 repeat protein